ncbi:GH1 family beta-glucosidase [Thermomonospora umbrina]|uniref:Beta-glucosidase n=1 Tax=Thermomonospora umbrina TaxID=111806 RepID=A0A3D9SPL1_9ACTN|nr:GH1 family beta-glucosidase [Thermomonospora umbrina]REE97557.1 beta-glucosidase [Thermomonospora umbrina]
MAFPPDFRWGVATAAYQIEGATGEDGRGDSVWDVFCREPGRVRDGHTGDVACDHYRRWPDDLDLMAGLGVDAYRFSIAWPRIQPNGRGPANPEGLDFYDRLVDGMLERGLTPFPTLFHWDLPQALEDAGGWTVRDTAHRFAEYAAVVAERLADRVGAWITLNEPMVVTAYGYAFGVYAPGRTLLLDALPTAHHQLLGHGLAVNALRDLGALQVGLSNHYTPAWAADESSADDLRAAATFDLFANRLFTDPVLYGRHPDLSPLGGPDPASYVRDEDLAVIAAPIDFLGVNYYQPTRVRAASGPLPFEIVPIEGHPTTGMGWPVVPDALLALLRTLKETYSASLPPLLITENGCAYDDRPGPDGVVDDPERVAFLESHLDAVRTAIADGVDVRGYFVWSFMDNFEWAEGYHPRFGLVHVDYETQRRTPRSSYGWYRDFVDSSRS